MYEIIVNPGSHSGQGLKIWNSLEKVLKKHDCEYHVNYTSTDDDENNALRELYLDYELKGERLHLIIMGGDGTVNNILQILPALDNITISVLPVGSGNDLVRSLGVKGSREAILEHIITNPVDLTMDVGYIHCENSHDPSYGVVDGRFIVSTGMGYDAAICEEAERTSLKSILNKLGLGKLIYLSVALKQLAGLKEAEATLTLGDGTILKLDKFMFLAGMNNAFEGGGFMFGGVDAKNDDGILELCAVNGVKKPKVLQIMPVATKGGHFDFDGVEHYRTDSYKIDSNVPLWIHTDGEVRAMADHISVTVKNKELSFVY